MVKQRDPAFYGTEKPLKILLKIAPPVMAALLIQALYNVVDSLFIGKYDPAGNGLNALSVIYTMQLIIIALAVGTGVGVNTYMAKLYAEKKRERRQLYGGRRRGIIRRDMDCLFGFIGSRTQTVYKISVYG